MPAQLDFADETFDVAVSNFVFHEVRSQRVKQLVVREALRVVKKGGVFVFHDMFEQKKLYGDMNAFIEQLRKEGIAEIHYIANTEKETFIPDFLSAPWMPEKYGINIWSKIEVLDEKNKTVSMKLHWSTLNYGSQ